MPGDSQESRSAELSGYGLPMFLIAPPQRKSFRNPTIAHDVEEPEVGTEAPVAPELTAKPDADVEVGKEILRKGNVQPAEGPQLRARAPSD